MSYTITTTFTKTTESPANAFDTMPVLTTILTEAEITARQAAYPTTWSRDQVSADVLVTTSTYSDKETSASAWRDPSTTKLLEARDKWAADNHVLITTERP